MTNNPTAPRIASNSSLNEAVQACRLVAVVPAGGVGLRASHGSAVPVPKQYRSIQGQPMLRWSVQALLADSRIDRVYVGVQHGDEYVEQALQALERVTVSFTAGATRALTVFNTLSALLDAGHLDQNDWVLVHDAARPGLPLQALQRLIGLCLDSGCGGLLAMQATDTVKLALDEGHRIAGVPMVVKKTVDRDRVWLAQTPQMYQARALTDALSGALRAGFEVTDESSAIEWAGLPSQLVAGDSANFKVTWPEDFERIERFIK